MWTESFNDRRPASVNHLLASARRYSSSRYQSSSWRETLRWYNRAWRYPLGPLAVETITVIGPSKVHQLHDWLTHTHDLPQLYHVIDKVEDSAVVIIVVVGLEVRVMGLNQAELVAASTVGGLASIVSMALVGRKARRLAASVLRNRVFVVA